MDIACAKYGWTLHYVLWEISYLNLKMMLTDAITADSSKGDTPQNREFINADDPANAEAILGKFGQ